MAAGWTVPLGADAWAVLRAAAPGVDLPPPFDLTPTTLGLDAGAAAAAEDALRGSGLAPGTTGPLAADLMPSVLLALTVLGSAPVRLRVQVQEPAGRRDGLWAVQGTVAASLTLADDGPVHLGAEPVDGVADAAVALLGHPGTGTPGGAGALTLDEATSLAALTALRDGASEIAASLLPPDVLAALADLTGEPLATALVTVVGPPVGLVRGAERWWRLTPRPDERVTLTPLGPGGPHALLVDLLAGALAAAPA